MPSLSKKNRLRTALDLSLDGGSTIKRDHLRFAEYYGEIENPQINETERTALCVRFGIDPLEPVSSNELRLFALIGHKEQALWERRSKPRKH
jgi:hypothetical protein